jgi:GDPmannose 4,6-dehydratase
MWLMLQQDKPDDYVVATGETYSVRDFVTAAFAEVGITLEWIGIGLYEKAIVQDIISSVSYRIPSTIQKGNVLVRIDPEFYRPSEVEYLIGDSTKARNKLGWKPKVGFNELVRIMVQSDYNRTSHINREE